MTAVIRAPDTERYRLTPAAFDVVDDIRRKPAQASAAAAYLAPLERPVFIEWSNPSQPAPLRPDTASPHRVGALYQPFGLVLGMIEITLVWDFQDERLGCAAAGLSMIHDPGNPPQVRERLTRLGRGEELRGAIAQMGGSLGGLNKALARLEAPTPSSREIRRDLAGGPIRLSAEDVRALQDDNRRVVLWLSPFMAPLLQDILQELQEESVTEVHSALSLIFAAWLEDIRGDIAFARLALAMLRLGVFSIVEADLRQLNQVHEPHRSTPLLSHRVVDVDRQAPQKSDGAATKPKAQLGLGHLKQHASSLSWTRPYLRREPR
jgi:hypothetical protein